MKLTAHINSNGKLVDEDFQGILSRYLSSSIGRQKLAAAMANPIRRNLDYQGIARRAIVVDPLPQGALPIYDRDVDVADVVSSDDELPVINFKLKLTINDHGKLREPVSPIFGRRVIVPTFEVFQSPTIRIDDVKQRRFNLIDRFVQKARDQIMERENANIFAAIDAADIVTTDSGNNKE